MAKNVSRQTRRHRPTTGYSFQLVRLVPEPLLTAMAARNADSAARIESADSTSYCRLPCSAFSAHVRADSASPLDNKALL